MRFTRAIFKSLPGALLALVAWCGFASAAVPAWVQPGVTAVYQGFFVDVVVITFTTVTARNGDDVAGTSISQTVGCPVCGKVVNWDCATAGAQCGGFQFWVDPNDPTASFTGPDGEILTVQGTAPFLDSAGQGTGIGNGVTYTATSMGYNNPQNNFTVHVEFEATSGLLLSYSQQNQNPNSALVNFFLSFNGGAVPPSNIALITAVLPSSRSVQVNVAATAFVTVINPSNVTGTNCGLSLGTAIPATFAYQTTNPATNALTGTVNTPVNIPGNDGAQSFIIAIKPTAAFNPTDVIINAACNNITGATALTGVSTLLLSASTTAVPDIVALAATNGEPLIVDLPGANGANAFAVATVNVGAGGAITVSTDTGNVVLPIAVTVCASNPGNGQCLGAPAANVTTTINSGATPTFSFFVTGNGTVTFAPGTNRIFALFKDAQGVVRGSTSVAVQTK